MWNRGGHDNPLQYSCLENPMNRGAWRATAHRVTKSWTRLTWLSTHIYSIISYENKDSFASSFPGWRSFVSFPCPIALNGTSNTLLSTSGKNENPCLVSDLRRKSFNISPLSMMLDVGLSYVLIMLEYILSIHSLLRVLRSMLND